MKICADMPMYIKAMLSNLLSSSQIDEKTKARYKKASSLLMRVDVLKYGRKALMKKSPRDNTNRR